jgi:hypothetical protein
MDMAWRSSLFPIATRLPYSAPQERLPSAAASNLWKDHRMAVSANDQALIAARIGLCAYRRYRGNMITPEQLRAARVLVRWTRARLAKESGVPIQTTQAFEQGRVGSPLMTTEHKWRRALEKAGVTLLEEDEHGGVGVRLKTRKGRR